MQTMRERWTDERLDDGFDRVSADIQSLGQETSALRQEMNDRFEHMESRFEHMESRFDRFEDKLDRWQRLLVSMFGGLTIALLGVVLSHM